MPPAFVSAFAAPVRAGPLSATSFAPPLRAPRVPRPAPRRAAAAPTMFFDFLPFQRKDVVALPQYDEDRKAARAKSLEEARENYQWTYEGVADAALIDGVPNGELPHLGWVQEVIFIAARIAINSAMTSVDDISEDAERAILANIAKLFSPVLMQIASGKFGTTEAVEAYNTLRGIVSATAEGTGVTLQDYKDLFRNIKLDTVAKLDQFLWDDIFGWYRVAGPNPMRITKLPGKVADMFPELTDKILNGITAFGGDSIAAMEADGRLYYVDFPEFEGVPVGEDVDGNLKPGFVYAPKCLLAVPVNPTERMTVLPIAIRCGQDSGKFPMYTPNSDHSDPVAWLAAKLTIQVSDALIHEAVYHLGRTHLLLELMVCSTYRTLPEQHPLHRLLKCHFYGTAFINNAAVETLINSGGTIDEITAPPIDLTRKISASAVNDPSFSFNDWMPDKELASRGVMDESLPYPYRDDAMKLWPVLNEWVRDFLSAYYKSDADVKGDYELANWCKEIVGPGKLHGFGETADGGIETLDYLVRAVSMIIFTASVQHAAVNYPQSTLMQFAPAMPLGAYAPAPTTAKPFEDVNDWVTKMIPDIPRAELQMITAELIGVLRYTTLGEYGKALDFAPEEVGEALEEFQDMLGVIGAKIQERNKKERRAGLPVYNYLVPKNIPQSINI